MRSEGRPGRLEPVVVILEPGATYYVCVGTDVQSSGGEGIYRRPRTEDDLPDGVARRWEVAVDPAVQVRLRVVGAPLGATLRIDDGNPQDIPSGATIVLRRSLAVGPHTVTIGTKEGVLVRDAALFISPDDEAKPVAHSFYLLPKRLVVTMTPTGNVGRGQEVTLAVEPRDENDAPMPAHVGVTVTVTDADHPGQKVAEPTTLAGSGTITFHLTALGRLRLSVAATALGQDIPVDARGRELALQCKIARPAGPVSWQSDKLGKQYATLLSDKGFVRLDPSWRRWLVPAPEGVSPPTVKTDGDHDLTLQDDSGPLASGRYRTTRDGYVEVPLGAKLPISVPYYCRPAQCGLIIHLSASAKASTAPAAEPLARELYELLGKLGYGRIYGCSDPDHLLLDALGKDYVSGAVPKDEGARAALDLLSLDDLFVVQPVGGARDGTYFLGWSIWSLGLDGKSAFWHTPDETQTGIRVTGQEGDPPFDRDALIGYEKESLASWLDKVGLRFPEGSARAR